MEVTTQGLCDILSDAGIQAAQAGDQTTAIARFDEVIARCAPASEPWMLVKTAATLFNKATCLRFASDTAEAAAVFDDIVARFSAMPDLVFRRYVCMALYNKGVALRTAGQFGLAIVAYDAAISHCRGTKIQQSVSGSPSRLLPSSIASLRLKLLRTSCRT